MPLRNPEVSARLNHLADLLEIEGANPFRVRAYRNAARVVGGLGHELEEMLEKGEDLDELPGIGKDLAEKLRVLVTTGELPLLKEVSKRVPPGLGELMEVPGLGPKRVQTLYRELHVRDLEDLKRAADAGRIRELAGFGEKTEEKLRQAVGEVQARTKRWLLADAEEFAEPLVGWLRSLGDVHKATIAGSYRRRRETVGDVDIIATCAKDKGESVIDRFVQYEEVHEVVSQGTTRATVILRCGLQVDLRVVAGVSYGAALHYFTGSREHNIALRSRAQNSGEKVNEYGIYRGDKRLAGKTEEEVYAHFGLAFIPPELREDRGELEAAEKDRLPELVTLEDIRGDLHCHTDYTDGHDSLEAMAREARKRGYEYLGITDHSKRVRVAGGLDARALGKELDAIDQLNDGSEGLRLLKGCEVDILRDGRLDLSDRTLARLDFTVCAIHYDRGLSRKQQTERVLRAMDNPHCNIIAHPSDRLIGEREPLALDMEAAIEAARERHCILEVNAQPRRMDLNDRYCRMAVDAGALLAISTDAHSTATLDYMRYGVGQARRGWVSARQVINTRSLKQLLKAFAR